MMAIDWQSPASWVLTTCTFGQCLHEKTLPFSNQEAIHTAIEPRHFFSIVIALRFLTAMPTGLVQLSDHEKEWSCFPHFPHSKKKSRTI